MTDRFPCKCKPPKRHPSPLKHGVTCVRCNGHLSPKWVSNDVLLGRFLDRLEEGMFPANTPVPVWFDQFKSMFIQREHEGRELYDLDYLGRDNLKETEPEAGDAGIYLYLDHLEAIRQHGEDDNFDAVLIAASRAAELFRDTQRVKARRRGAP